MLIEHPGRADDDQPDASIISSSVQRANQFIGSGLFGEWLGGVGPARTLYNSSQIAVGQALLHRELQQVSAKRRCVDLGEVF